MHGLGSGKTINAINLAHNSKRDTVVLLPKSLKQNFIDELMNYVPEYNRPNNYNLLSEKDKQKVDKQILQKISKRYTFVSSNAGTAAKKLSEVGVSKENDKALGKFTSAVKSLDNKILIIDEVHNLLVNMIDPTAKNGSKILEQIMNAKNLRLIFLSGSPVVSDPFELAILYNMLRGYIRIKGSNELYTAFPREYDTFNKYFVDKDTNTIKNKAVFQERIVGLTSYYIGATNDMPDSTYPYRHLPTVVKVHMSDYQWKIYLKFRNEELDEERKAKYSKKQFVKQLNKKPGRQSNTTFRVKTRQISDFALPLGFK
jgi:superfamily II DNA or RNA helicase